MRKENDMKCEKCIHNEACDLNRRLSGNTNSLMYDDDCGLFKDKERYIELPSKVGDTVYYLNTQYHMALHRNTIYEAKVARIVITSLGVALVIHIRDESGCCEVPDVKDFGKTVFLTREEAEKALAERSRQ